MDNATLQTILDYVVGFLGGGVGATLLTVCVKSAVTAVAKAKIAKHSKVTDADKKDIANMVTDNVLTAIEGGVNLNADAMLDKYTNKRIEAIEGKVNELCDNENKVAEYAKLTMQAVGDFRTISPDTKAKINELVNGVVIKYVEPVAVAEQPTLEVKTEKKTAVMY